MQLELQQQRIAGLKDLFVLSCKAIAKRGTQHFLRSFFQEEPLCSLPHIGRPRFIDNQISSPDVLDKIDDIRNMIKQSLRP